MNETIDCSFSIHCPGSLLWWLISIAFLGSVVTGVMIWQAGRFILNDKAERISLQGFHRIGSKGRITEKLGSMNVSARRSMRNGLTIDYVFMPFFYSLLICLSIFVRSSADIADNGWGSVLHMLCWLPVGMLLLDMLENSASLGLLIRFEEKGIVETGSVLLMAISSWTKWGLGAAWILLMLSHGISRAIEH